MSSIEALFHFVYGENLEMVNLGGGLIISPTNKAVNEINEIGLAMLEGAEECFEAVDTLAPGMEQFLPPEEEIAKIAAKMLKVEKSKLHFHFLSFLVKARRHCCPFEEFERGIGACQRETPNLRRKGTEWEATHFQGI